ncbi:MAG TPA: transposase, partial [Terriglobales bacterium]|nr:transposase [Terriglobales bacterium]
GYIESFNGKLRDECLNQHWFLGLADARRLLADWRDDYNHHRPHTALGGLTPDEAASAVAPYAPPPLALNPLPTKHNPATLAL